MTSEFLPLALSFSNLITFMAKTNAKDFYTLDIFHAFQYYLACKSISSTNNDSWVFCKWSFIPGSI